MLLEFHLKIKIKMEKKRNIENVFNESDESMSMTPIVDYI